MRIFVASAIVFNSSSRAATVASWSAAVVMHVELVVASDSCDSFRSDVVVARSPSAVALVPSEAYFAAFSSVMCFVSTEIWSSKDCFRSS